MQITSTITTYICDICGMKREIRDDDHPISWVHVSDHDLDFCPGCMEAAYDAAVANKEWYVSKFGQTPVTTYSENQYLSLKKEYEDLKSKYDDLREKYDNKMKAASFGV